MREITVIQQDKDYLISNTGINRESIFKEQRNYYYFLKLYNKYIPIAADTLAFCLVRNEFQFLIKTKKTEFAYSFDINCNNTQREALIFKSKEINKPSLQLSHFFNSYSQSINKAYNRSGGLFESPFRRELITEENLTDSIYRIHKYPQIMGEVDDFSIYPFSSYQILTNEFIKTLTAFEKSDLGNRVCFKNAVRVNFLNSEDVINSFGSYENFLSYHKTF